MDVQNNTWVVESQRLPMKSSFVCAAPLTQHGTIVAVGENGLCRIYSPLHRRWQALPPMIEGRWACGVVILGDEIVVAGGYCRDSSSVERLKLDDEGQPLGSWEAAPGMTQKREGCAAVVAEGKIVVVGGFDCESFSPLSSAEMFDPLKNTWEGLPDMATKREGCAAVATEDKIFVFGGEDGRSRHNSAEYLCLHTKKWHSLPPMRKRRSNPAVVAIGGRILVVGGEDEEERKLSDVEVLDASTMRWEEDHDVPSLNTGRYSHGATTLRNRIYVVGGRDKYNMLDTMEILEVQLQLYLEAEIAKRDAEIAKLSAEVTQRDSEIAKLRTQIERVNTTWIQEPSPDTKPPQPDYSEFETRTDLEAEVATLRKQIQDSIDSFDLDAITLAVQARKRLRLLEELVKTMPTAQQLRSDISDLEERIRRLGDQDRLEEAIPLARKRGELVEQLCKEEMAEGQKTLLRPSPDKPR